MPGLNLLVLRTPDPAKLKAFYELLGFQFQEEKHGTGPLHYPTRAGSALVPVHDEPATVEFRGIGKGPAARVEVPGLGLVKEEVVQEMAGRRGPIRITQATTLLSWTLAKP